MRRRPKIPLMIGAAISILSALTIMILMREDLTIQDLAVFLLVLGLIMWGWSLT